MKHKLVLNIMAIALTLSLIACGKSSVTNATPTSKSPAGNTPVVDTPIIPADSLAILSTNSFVDSFGTYHVVGGLINNSSNVLTHIELSIEIKDASGTSLITDDNGNVVPNAVITPMLYTLAPGESSPFEYSYETSKGTPGSYNVAITGQQTGDANRAILKSENVQLMDDGSGWYYLTGELVNTSSQWAHIRSLAGGVLDDSKKLLSADWTSTYTTELAPAGDASGRDRTPFEVNFPNPGGATKWQVFPDADVVNNVTDYPIGLSVTNSYFDQYGSFHVVGWITNNYDKALDSMVVAGVFAQDKTVLDSSYAFVPIPMKPGVATPFSVSSFSSINYNHDQAALVSSYSAQADPWSTTPTSFEFVDLSPSGESGQKDGATWTIDGNVINTSGKNLSGVTVVVMIKDAQNQLVAMEYTSILPEGDAITEGETSSYSVPVYLDPVIDSSGFTASTVIIGSVK
jgi:hypothetical protein